MKTIGLVLLAVIAGILVVLQGGFNAKLGIHLNNSLLATLANLSIAAIFTSVAVVITIRQYPSSATLQSIPAYYYLIGALCSFLAVSLFYFLIPKLGIGTTVLFSLSGQIVFALVASHFAWFGFPAEPISLQKLIGLVCFLAGVILIKF